LNYRKCEAPLLRKNPAAAKLPPFPGAQLGHAIHLRCCGQHDQPKGRRNNTTSYVWDTLNRRTSRALPLGQTKQYIYDFEGTMSSGTKLSAARRHELSRVYLANVERLRR